MPKPSTKQATNRAPAPLVLPAPRPAIRVIGIDPSLNSTGYAYRYQRDGTAELYTGHIDPRSLRGPYRLAYVRNQMARVLDAAQPQLAVYEDYAMGAGKGPRSNNAFHLGELGGVLKTLLWERGVDILLVSPGTLKKALTGNGHADRGVKGKPMMRAALAARYGVKLMQDDEADGFALLALGERWAGSRHAAPDLDLGGLSDLKLIAGKADVRAACHSAQARAGV
jgi:Holliday junction resolvasome RuvABC endonuclease subunit